MSLTPAEIARYLRMGTHVPEGPLAARVAALKAEAERIVTPRRAFVRCNRAACAFTSVKLARHLAGCTDVFFLCTTLGAAFDAWMRRVSVASGADALIAQAIGAAAIEKWTDACEDEIRARLSAGETLAPRYSPGYGDFPLAANRTLLARLDAARAIGVSLTDTLLLVPSKTVTAVIGVRAAPLA